MLALLMRHGAAVDPGEAGGDAPRWLTEAGRRSVSAQAERLLLRQFRPDAVLSSPFVRAMQTAELIADGLRFEGEISVAQEFHPNFGTTADAVEALRLASAPVVLAVGHEPSIRVLASHLAGQTLPPFRTGMICCIRFEEDGSSTGEWLLDPTQESPFISLQR